VTKKMSAAGQELLNDVLDIKAGAAARTWSPEQILVIQVRRHLNKTQNEFAGMLKVPVGTIQDWEQGRRKPDSAAITLIKVAQKYPDAVMDVA